ncbi:MAG: hypothetical protein RL752_408 [Actinomycetota bacterium]|jgi:formate hydrogenlyase subunit 3/multisubunit Na+/H+ antiporter MnhD subunit
MAENSNRSQFEVTLAYMAIGVIGLSLISMAATLILTALGVQDLPAFMAQLPLIGFPVGFLLIIGMLIASIIRRGKENRG